MTEKEFKCNLTKKKFLYCFPKTEQDLIIEENRKMYSNWYDEGFDDAKKEIKDKIEKLGKKAFIQGNVISFDKLKYKSNFFDAEEVIVFDKKELLGGL